MKTFISHILLFFFILGVILTGALFLPSTPRASESLLFSAIRKDSLLQHAPSPRIIFIGGSNLSFGINSRQVYDSLKLFPINTGIQASLGLFYMLDHTLPYIKENDIVVLSSEYQQYFGHSAYGGEALLKTIFDLSLKEITYLSRKQWQNIIPYLPRYALSKFYPSEYYHYRNLNVYGVSAFNIYGDVYTHRDSLPQQFKPYPTETRPLNQDLIKRLEQFKNEVAGKRAQLFITFPGLQFSSYLNSRNQIKKLESVLHRQGFNILGTPEEYLMHDSLLFNTPYHLNRKGIDARTAILIGNLKRQLR